MTFTSLRPTAPLWRVGRGDRPWTLPDWPFVGGERFDDPRRDYRVYYGATERLCAFVEVLAPFRPPAESKLDPKVSSASGIPAGTVPASWRLGRRAGAAVVDGQFADVGTVEWLSHLNDELAPELARFGIKELDGSTIRDTKVLELTQAISRVVYDYAEGGSQFAGIYYESPFGTDLHCWAAFEGRVHPYHVGSEAFQNADPELVRACELLGLTLIP